jgi:hypothetical protein
MSKQKRNATPASAGGIAGWPGDKGPAQASLLGLPAFSPLRAVYARYKALRQQWKRVAGGQGKAVSVDEIARLDARMPLFNFTGAPGALQWWPGDHRHF